MGFRSLWLLEINNSERGRDSVFSAVNFCWHRATEERRKGNGKAAERQRKSGGTATKRRPALPACRALARRDMPEIS
jgi:hypothetical protein